jgi:phage terminase small subunit
VLQRGRKSSAGLDVVEVDGGPAKLQAPPTLSAAERDIFDSLVGAVDRRHFRRSDLPLLLRYCEACALADEAARELRGGAVVGNRVSPWVTVQEKATRAIVALSLRLRLAPQSRLHAKSAARLPAPGPRPWE